jgi:hypothetical protein
MWIARKELKPAMESFIKGTVDANTALRIGICQIEGGQTAR